MICAALLYPKK